MNFFENELRKIVAPLFSQAVYVGRSCFVYLDEKLRAKVYFDTRGHADHYPVIRADIINRTEGIVDRISIQMADVMEQCASVPYIVESGGGVGWVGHQPVDEDYKAIRQALMSYLNVWEVVK